MTRTITLPELPPIAQAGPLKLQVPDELALPDLSQIGDRPDLIEFAALEAWYRIITWHWHQRMHALWNAAPPGTRDGTKERLTEITGMSRTGARRRGSLTYDEAMKDHRRSQPPTRPGADA